MMMFIFGEFQAWLKRGNLNPEIVNWLDSVHIRFGTWQSLAKVCQLLTPQGIRILKKPSKLLNHKSLWPTNHKLLDLSVSMTSLERVDYRKAFILKLVSSKQYRVFAEVYYQRTFQNIDAVILLDVRSFVLCLKRNYKE